jgi:serine/threonine protein kinase/tetratricopeptide (TPR) repeat protein
MENKDWPRIEELFHEVFDMAAEERAAYLDRACPDAPALRAEVESLILTFHKQREFMEYPALNLGLKAMAEGVVQHPLTDKLIGSYKILKPLGKGGMGEVYLAEDVRLNRKVALKFLSNSLLNDSWAKRRLIKEAQAVAKVDHPNICTVHGLEEHDGYSFIVMQYIEGETLASLIHEGRLESKQVPQLAFQIASALAEAHSYGILHRDIKPQNIMVTAAGQAKVLDFGLAKTVQQKSPLSPVDSTSQDPHSGLVIGTVSYMSPEQLRAERLDLRSDIFSFGIVLYEMISGHNPFACGSNADTIAAILTSKPEPLKDFSPDIPAHLARITNKCLRMDREQRYQSASELLLNFESPRKAAWHLAPRLPYVHVGPRFLMALLFLVVIIGAVLFSPRARVQTLAVLPIVNQHADMQYLTEGLTENLVRKLSRFSSVKVKAPNAVPFYKGQDTDPQKVGIDLNADVVLSGEIIQNSDSFLLHVSLLRTADGAQVWQGTYSMSQAAGQNLPEELISRVASELNLPLNEVEKELLTARQTENPEAFRLYLLGRHYWRKRNRDNIKKAIEYFKQAINLDPVYALAHAGLADSYVLLNSVAFGSMPTREAMSQARAAARAALEINPSLCEGHTAMGVILLRYDWKWQEAEKEFKLAIELNPDYPPAHFWYSHLLALMGRFPESIAESEAAAELDPFSPLSYQNHGRAFYYSGNYDKALEYYLKVLEDHPENLSALNGLGLIYQQKGLLKDSVAVFERLYNYSKQYGAAPLGYAYARVGRKADAEKILQELEDLSKYAYISAQEKAIICVGLGKKDQAFQLLQEACDERYASLPFLLIEPVIDPLRSDPRFAELVRCVGMETRVPPLLGYVFNPIEHSYATRPHLSARPRVISLLRTSRRRPLLSAAGGRPG